MSHNVSCPFCSNVGQAHNKVFVKEGVVITADEVKKLFGGKKDGNDALKNILSLIDIKCFILNKALKEFVMSNEGMSVMDKILFKGKGKGA